MRIRELLQQMDAAYARHDMDGALAWADKALVQKPKDRVALERILTLYIDNRQKKQAQATLDLLQRQFSLTGYNLFLQCRVEYLHQQYDLAIQHGEDALQRGDMELWQTAMVHNILGRVYRELGQMEEAVCHYAVSGTEEYTGPNPNENMKLMQYADYSNYLFTLHYTKADRESLFQAASHFSQLFTDITVYEHDKLRHQHQKLRIGYISPDFRRHVVAFFIYAMLKEYDRSRFEIYAYANCDEDAISEEYKACIDGWCNILYMTPQQAAQQIYDDEIDILVDLAGHTSNNCLPVLAYKPAPVQVSGIGWFDTTGLNTVDYFLADYYTDPVGMNEAYFTEKLLRLPHSHFCYMWHDAPTAIQMSGYRQNGYITFGSFNNFAKVRDEVLVVWGEILRQVPNSRLYLKAKIFNIPAGRRRVKKRLQQAGIPLERVIIEKAEQEYLHCYQKMDIALDTWPYPGGGTTCDALYMGVPVITLVGTRHNSRFGYSLLMNMGLEECCAFSAEEYIAKAVKLAQDSERLSELHQNLRRMMRQSPVMDEGLYMADLEAAYELIWEHWLQNETGALDVSSIGKASAAVCEERAIKFLEDASVHGAKRAKIWLQRTVAQTPQNAMAWAMLSEVNHQLLDYEGEYQAAKIAIATAGKPGNLLSKQAWQEIHCRLGFSALVRGNHAEAFEAYREAWQSATNEAMRLSMFDSLLLTAHYLPFSSQDIFDLTRIYQGLLPAVKKYTQGNQLRPVGGKIRLGYLSPDFRLHVMFAMYYGMLACYDKNEFEVICYSLSDKEDGYTEEIKRLVDDFVPLAQMTSEMAAKRIYADKLDILIDLAGHSLNNGLRIMAYKPAPIQISGLGYLSTTGMKEIDYFLTDEIVDPAESHEAYFTENLLYLPSQFAYTGRSDVPVPQGAPCRDKGYITFGVFNHYRKITDDMLVIWQEIMGKVPNSRLLLKSQELISDSLVDQAYQRLQKLGFDMERVQFESADLKYMDKYLDIDIGLDTYPYTGGGTTFDSLYMGVPVVTRFDERRNTRFGLSVLTQLGLPELAAADRDTYIKIAVSLAEDWDVLDMLHKELREFMQKANSIRPQEYVKELEKQYKRIVCRQ